MKEPSESIREAVRRLFLDYEQNGDPWRFRVRGWSLWPVYRFRISLELLAHAGGNRWTEPSVEEKPSVVGALKDLARCLPAELAGLRRISRPGEAVTFGKTGAGWRRDMVGGRMFDMSFDFLEPCLEGFALSEACTSRQAGNPYPVVFNEYEYTYRALRLPCLKRADSVEEALLDDFASHAGCSDFAREYGLPENVSRRGLASRFLANMEYWRRIFRLSKPELFLIVCSYGQEHVVAAARSLGIPTWELQHGTISEHHFGYNYAESAREHAVALPLPTRVLTFGRYFSEVLTSCGYWREEQVPVIGFPRLSHFKSLAEGSSSPPRGEIRILASTQWTLEDEYLRFVGDCEELLPEGVRLLVKPHPRTVERGAARLRSLSSDKVEVLDKRSSIYDALTACHVHCSAYSTTLFESVGMGIPTVVLGMEGWENMKVLLESGAASFAADAAGLRSLVEPMADDLEQYDVMRQRAEESGRYFYEPFEEDKVSELLKPPGC